jgi:hypothetical protein
MSRTTKQSSVPVCSWRPAEPNDPPGTEKAGARRRPSLQPRDPRQSNVISDRRSYGSTEKILRRNRKLWTRLFAKVGRRLDKEATQESVES